MSSFVINPYAFTKAFVPTDISGCALWYDMSDATTMYTDQGVTLVSANNDSVRRINDKSGNSRYAESLSASANMNYVTNAQNGLSVLDAIDTTNGYRVEAQSWFNLNSVSAFVVAKANALDGNYRIFWSSRNTGGGNSDRFYIGATSTNFQVNVSGATAFGMTTSDTTDYHIHNLVHGSAVAEYFIDGTSRATSSVVNTNAPFWSGFGYLIDSTGSSPSLNINANFCEIIFYNSALSLADRGKVETYLSTKWNISL
jgi:hypothetical protein